MTEGMCATSPDVFTLFADTLLTFAAVGGAGSLLDVACGTGAVTWQALTRLQPESRVVGVDVSPHAIARCRANAGGSPAQSSFSVMDAHDLRVDSDAFDWVCCAFALRLFVDPDGAVAEMCRVARPGGTVAVSVFAPERDRRWWWLAGIAQRASARTDARPRVATCADVEAYLRRPSLHEVASCEKTLDVSYASAEAWLEDLVAHPRYPFLSELGGRERAQFGEAVTDRLELARERDGRIHHRIAVTLARARKQPAAA